MNFIQAVLLVVVKIKFMSFTVGEQMTPDYGPIDLEKQILKSEFIQDERQDSSNEKGDMIHQPDYQLIQSRARIFIDHQNFIPMHGFGPVIENSFLVFRGMTQLFNFNDIQSLGVPHFHLTSLLIFDRIKSLNNSLAFRWFVRQQVTIIGDTEMPKSAIALTYAEYRIQIQTVLPVHPQTLVVMSTNNIFWKKTLKQPKHTIFDVFENSGGSVTSLLNYDLEAKRPLNAHLFCRVCLFQKNMFHNDKIPRLDIPTFRFSWDVNNVAAQLTEIRWNISRGGRNVFWQIPAHVGQKLGWSTYVRRFGFPITENGGSRNTKRILGLDIMEKTVLSALFSAKEGTSSTQCLVCSDCSDYDCPVPQSSFGFGTKPRTFMLQLSEVSPLITMTLNGDIKNSNDSIVFITSERVEVTRIGSMVQRMNVFEPVVWIWVGFGMSVTALLFTVRFRINVSKTTSSGCGLCSVFVPTLAYLSLAFFGQYPRELPFKEARPEAKAADLRLHLVPWVLGTTLLTNWYTAFLSSSFNFPFPYELDVKDWYDFENFSIYIMEGDWRREVVGRTYMTNLHGNANALKARQLLVQDVQDFPDGLKFNFSTGISAGTIYYPPATVPSATTLHLIYNTDYSDVYWDDMKHQVLGWFRRQVVRIRACISSIQVKSKVESKCPNEQAQLKLAKMIYRLDMINPREMSMYIGTHYKNLTRQARKLGMEMIRKLGNKTYRADRTSTIKKNFTEPNSHELKPNLNTFYWMTRKSEAVFLVTKSAFPWYWNLFKKIMRDDPSLKFAHTGSRELKNMRIGQGLGGNGFESPVSISGPWDKYMPEFEWMMQRMRALTHSGILGFFAKWDQIVHPPTPEPANEFIEESDTGYQALTLKHDLVITAVIIVLVALSTGVLAFTAEISFAALV